MGTIGFILLLAAICALSLFSQWKSRKARKSEEPRARVRSEAWALVGALTSTVVGVVGLFVVENTVLFIVLIVVGVANIGVSFSRAIWLWRAWKSERTLGNLSGYESVAVVTSILSVLAMSLIGGGTICLAATAHNFDVEGRELDAPDIQETYIDPDVLPAGAYPQYILRNPGLRGTEVVGVEFLGKMMPVVAPGAHKIELKEGGADILHLMPCYLARAALPDGSVSEADRFTLITGTEEGEKSIPLETDAVERINAEIDSLRNTGTCVNGMDFDLSPLPTDDAAGNQVVPRQLLVPPTGN